MADNAAQEVEGQEEQGPRKFTFPSHQSHLLGLAKMCQANKDYTDCVIQCDKGGDSLRAHRIILGSASPFLKSLFSEIPQSLAEATILVPGVKNQVVAALLDFLYTGEMTVDRSDTADLQRLIETLQIDPELITVDIVEKLSTERKDEIEKSVEKPTENVDEKSTETSTEAESNTPTNVESSDRNEVEKVDTPEKINKRKLDSDEDDKDDPETKKSKV